MEVLLKSLFPANLYLRWFNPKEDNNKGVNVFLHIKDINNNGTYTLKFKPNVSRYDVVSFLKQIHENSESINNYEDMDELLQSSLISNSNGNSNGNSNSNSNGNSNIIENNEMLKQELSCLFEFYSVKELETAMIKLNIFRKKKFIFLGETTISVSHEQDETNKLWYTHFIKNQNMGKNETQECIGCICNKLSFVFDNEI